MRIDFITFTKLILPTNQTQSGRNVGNGERVNTLEGEDILLSRISGRLIYLQMGSKGIFLGFRSLLHLIITYWFPVFILTLVPAANATNAGWSWPKMTKDSTYNGSATVLDLLDLTPPKELNWTQFMIGTRATYTECKDDREAWRQLLLIALCSFI